VGKAHFPRISLPGANPALFIMAEGFKDTLHLPQTDFPMRGNLPAREPELFAQWDETGLYERIIERRASAPTFILHDGPPYANGNIHMGHTLNKVLKDIVVRYKSMRGHRAPYVPGWDCHGLPIEQQVLKKVGDKIHDMAPGELRNLCQDYAQEWIGIQRDQFKRLGILGDWDRPYTTLQPSYESGILNVLAALTRKGLIRKGFKTVHWDPIFRTALAEAEIEYHAHESPSIYVAMPVLDAEKHACLAGLSNPAFVIWTTTPWTMPANLGISLNPELPYVALAAPDGRHFIVAEGLAESFQQACGLGELPVAAHIRAADLERAEAAHPFFSDVRSLVMLGDHVTLEQGTGCVHTAPGHGADDFIIGKAYGLPVFCPVDAKGCYTDEFPDMAGEFVFKANPKIVERLREKGLLLAHKQVRHEYPFSWRSKHPIIFRATEQWFMELADGGVRERALEAIDEAVQWIPHWGRERIRSMVERRPEWCLSRQRHWGVPIPAIRSKATGKSCLDARIIERFVERVREVGTNAWYDEPLETFLPPDFVHPETGETGADAFEMEFDILDVWFDSGASHVAVLEQDERLHSPADLYLEGSDQHRGWFQSALLLGIGARDKAPFKTVLTHGFVLDGEGKAMSKSVGNVISPLDLINKYGADILRLWVASTDYRNDIGISDEIVRTTADAYRTVRNSLRFQLGNLYDFRPAEHAIPHSDLNPLDQWALGQLAALIKEVTEAFEAYEFHRVYHLLNRYFTVTLSARYHDFIKDRLYTTRADGSERRSAQTVLHHHAQILLRLLAPFLTFTADEAWAHLPADPVRTASVHESDWPEIPAEWVNSTTTAEVERLFEVRERVNERLEAIRTEKIIGKSIDAAVTFTGSPGDDLFATLARHERILPELFIVSSVTLNADPAAESLSLQAEHAPGVRCPRCWRWVPALVETAHGAVCDRCADALPSA
jgi:isoleucyl-tRNA synthetase